MGRPSLDPAAKAARYEAARTDARRLNRRKVLPQRVYAFGMPSGKVYIRYEPTHGPKVTLQSPFGTPEFLDEVSALMKGGSIPLAKSIAPKRRSNAVQPGTVQAVCEEFFRSAAFLRYSARDQRIRRNILERVWSASLHASEPNGDRFGEMPMQRFQFSAISALKERFARIKRVPDEMYPEDRNKDRCIPTTPEAGNSVVRAFRAVFEWAKEHHPDLVGGRNWAREVRLYRSSQNGWRVWKAEQCAAYEARHPRGTKARLVYDLAKHSRQRLSDVARLGPEMMDYDHKGRERLSFVQTKNRNAEAVTAFVPVMPDFKAALSAARANGVLGQRWFIATTSGGRYSEQSLGNYFRRCCKEAGLSGYSMHGLRKTGVIALIEAGCSWHEIMSITGHRSRKEIERYGREFFRGTASSSAFDRLLADKNEPIDEGERLRQAA